MIGAGFGLRKSMLVNGLEIHWSIHPTPKVESEGVTDTKPETMEVDGKNLSVKLKEFRFTQSLAGKGHLTKHQGILTTAATDAVPQLREFSEQSISWATPSLTPRDAEESELQPVCPPEVLPAASLSSPMASKPETPRALPETEKSCRMVRWRRHKVFG